MAEEKSDSGFNPADSFWVLLIIVVIFYALAELYRRFTIAGGFLDKVHAAPGSFTEWFLSIFPNIQLVSIFLTGLLLILVIYLSKKISTIIASEKKDIEKGESEYIKRRSQSLSNIKWDRIQYHISSNNPADWKAAIMEADIMLDDLLDTLGHHGDSMGDKLKQIEQSDFNTLNEAWEAHKVRNKIAHEGGDYLLTEREARRIIGLYQKVFEEFRII